MTSLTVDQWKRGSGRTTRQLRELPQRSCFVVSGFRAYEYTSRLAKHIGRSDVLIIHPDNFERTRGLEFAKIELDHDIYLNEIDEHRLRACYHQVRLKPVPFEWPRLNEAYWNTRLDEGSGP